MTNQSIKTCTFISVCALWLSGPTAGQTFTGFNNRVVGDTASGQDLVLLANDADPNAFLELEADPFGGPYTLGG
ncbi:MAG: hypothetical protein AAGH99_16310, partial [Planctomycetota bacterium]